MTNEKKLYIFESILGTVLAIAVIVLASVLHAWNIFAVIVGIVDVLFALHGVYKVLTLSEHQGA